MTANAKHNHWDPHCKEYQEPVGRFMTLVPELDVARIVS